MVTVRFCCGHQQDVDTVNSPQCKECGETRVQMVKAPNPVFRGACASPLKEK